VLVLSHTDFAGQGKQVSINLNSEKMTQKADHLFQHKMLLSS